jgi:protein-tyrosine phosphatase
VDGVNGRALSWEGCVNVRDLGGLPVEGGGTTRFGRVIRADNVHRLSPRGWEDLRAYGVRRIVDLRFVRERDDEQPPPSGLEVFPISLFGDHDPAEAEREEAVLREATDEVSAIELFYTSTLQGRRPQVAAALEAVAQAREGAVVVHCFVGKDRTGIVSALLLRLAGVSAETVAADYALSGPVVGPLVDDWIAAAEDEQERAFRRRVTAAPAEALLRVLRWIETEWGGEERYVREAGVSAGDVTRLRARLLA